MAMTEAELAEQERRATMAAAGISVGPVDGAKLCDEVRRLQDAIMVRDSDIAVMQIEIEGLMEAIRQAEQRYAEELAALRQLHAETVDALKAELATPTVVTFSPGIEVPS